MSEQKIKSPSWLDKFNARMVLLITPEYAIVKRSRSAGYGAKPTFPKPLPMPLSYRTISGVKIRFAHAYSAGKPTVVLLNPLPQSIVAYAPIWERLSSQFNLYAYDLPGFAGSEGGAEWMTFEAQGRFLGELIDELGIQKPHLVAPDIGMPAALHYVTHFPNDVESLAVGDGPAILPSSIGSVVSKAIHSRFWRMMFRVTGAGTFVHASNQLGYLNYVPNPEEVSDYIRGGSGRVGPITLWFKGYPQNLATIDPKLADINKPVLVFWGEQDQLLLVDNAHRLSQRLKRSRLHVLKNCGHFCYQDQHEEFGRMVIDWISAGYKTL
jgi:pimeloyl-ACP methyl ester carboxylesterase